MTDFAAYLTPEGHPMPDRSPTGQWRSAGPTENTGQFSATDIAELKQALDALNAKVDRTAKRGTPKPPAAPERRQLAWSAALVWVVALLAVCGLLAFGAWLYVATVLGH